MFSQLTCVILFFSCFSSHAYLSHWVVSQTDLSKQPMLIQSLARHNSDTMAITEYIVKGIQVIYDEEKSEPRLRSRWQQMVTAPASKLVYVGHPNYPFPDHWPWTSVHSAVPENSSFAEKYSNFKQKMQAQVEVAYQIDGNFHLHGFNVRTGGHVVDLNLCSLLNIAPSNETNIVFPRPELTTMDVFFNQKWHSLLIGVVGYKKQFIFCLDVTSPHLLSNASAHHLLLWHKKSQQGGFTSPTVVRSSDQRWQLIIGQVLKKNETTTQIKEKIHVLSLDSGQTKQTILLPSQQSIKTKNTDDFLFLTPIDSQNRGYVDYLYIADKLGNIWKFSLEKNIVGKSTTSNSQLLFSMKHPNRKGSIITQPKIVAHPEYGVVLTFLTKYEYQPDAYLVSLWDNHQKSYLWNDLKLISENAQENWYKPVLSNQEDLTVRSGRVVFVQKNQQVAVFDLFNGKKYQIVRCKQYNSTSEIKSTEWLGNTIIFHHSKHNRSFFMHALRDEKYAVANLDFESDKLGRRIWRQL